jgi:hypothetical protein
VRGNDGTSSKTQPVTNPALEKPLLKLHRAIDIRSFWKAVHQLLSASIPSHSVGSSLQQSAKRTSDLAMDSAHFPRISL